MFVLLDAHLAASGMGVNTYQNLSTALTAIATDPGYPLFLILIHVC